MRARVTANVSTFATCWTKSPVGWNMVLFCCARPLGTTAATGVVKRENCLHDICVFWGAVQIQGHVAHKVSPRVLFLFLGIGHLRWKKEMCTPDKNLKAKGKAKKNGKERNVYSSTSIILKYCTANNIFKFMLSVKCGSCATFPGSYINSWITV